ncbi:MAG TPA: hypothetical protein VFQ36_21375 [Ktedonobacteraceae bacterium]|nr:hypothetical protein [Ktedonobacteraceae bacterium]
MLRIVIILFDLNVLTAFGITAAIGSLLIEAIYIDLALGAIRFLMQEPGKWWRWFILLVAIAVPFLGLYGSVVPFPAWPGSLGVYCALGGVLISAIWTVVMLLRYPQRIGAAGQAHAWE